MDFSVLVYSQGYLVVPGRKTGNGKSASFFFITYEIMKTNKSPWYFLFTLLLACGTVFSFTSCSDDDDNEGGSESFANSSSLVKDAKVLLTNVKIADGWNLYFDYDESFRPIASGDEDGEDWRIDYNAGKIYLISSFGDNTAFSCTFNGKGHMTSLKGTWNVKDDEDGEVYSSKGSINVSLTYDGEGHQLKTNGTFNEEYTEYGYTGKYNDKIVQTYTWKDGNLMSMVEKTETTEDGETETYTETVTISYGNQDNKYRQNPIVFGWDEEYSLRSAGVLGIGSAKLAVSFKEIDDETYDQAEATYNLNPDGTIAVEDWKGYYHFELSYTPISSYKPASARIARPVAASLSAREKVARIKRFARNFRLVQHKK